MRYLPFCLQQCHVEKTTNLLAKQYKTFSRMYDDPLESQGQIFENLVQYRYQRPTDQSKARDLLQQCPTLLDLSALIIEILDKECEFNKLPLKRQVQLEHQIQYLLYTQDIFW